MKLLNTNSIRLEEFIGQNIPEYAILSHTWEDDEVSFQDLQDPWHTGKKGFAKIFKTCQLAAAAGIRYAWVDTCCIDKSSSAELTESINSMFSWYSQASECYVYLSDMSSSASFTTAFPHSRWLTRGWTLQELIAPEKVNFFDQGWNFKGSKSGLSQYLATVTGIDPAILSRSKGPAAIPVAQRMAWAASRSTTRVEDTAYCLFGIFGVNMPLLYGEGEKAFRRLQEHIIQSTPDYSIFAWTLLAQHLEPTGGRTYSGVLASCPREFSDCTSVAKFEDTDMTSDFYVSNQGIRMRGRFHIEPIPGAQGQRYILPVCTTGAGATQGIGIRKCGPSRYVRENPYVLLKLASEPRSGTPGSRYLVTDLVEPGQNGRESRLYDDRAIFSGRPCVLQIRLPRESEVCRIWPWHRWDDEDQLFFVGCGSRRDWGAVIVSGRFSAHIGNSEINLKAKCMIYVLGWGSPSSRSPQYKCLTTGCWITGLLGKSQPDWKREISRQA